MGIFQAIGKGFSQSFKLWKAALIFFIFNFGVGLIMLPFAGPQNVGSAKVTAIALLVSAVSVLAFIFLQGGTLGMIRDLLKKNTASMAEFTANGLKYYVRILGLFIVVILIALVVVLLVVLVAAGILAIANNMITRVLIAAIVTVLALAAAVLLLFPIYAIVADEVGPIAAIKQGLRTSIANFWKVLVLMLVLFLVTFGIAFAIGILIALITGATPTLVGQVITLFVNSVLQSYFSLVMMVALMAYYLAVSTPRHAEKGPAGF